MIVSCTHFVWGIGRMEREGNVQDEERKGKREK
jgi:hypothetical protein